MTLETYGNKTYIKSSNSESISEEDPFNLVRKNLGYKQDNLSGLPFCGGAIGYFSYDLCRRLENLPDKTEKKIDMPDMSIGIYDWSIFIDHHVKK